MQAGPLKAMNMKITTFDSLDSLLPDNTLPKPHLRHGHRLGVDPMINANAAAELSPLDALEVLAGVQEGLTFSRKSLRQRLRAPVRAQTQRKTPTPTRRAKVKVGEKEGRDDDEQELFAPVEQTLDLLRNGADRERQAEVEAMLAKYFDPLQRYHVFYEALDQIEENPLGGGKDRSVKKALTTMMNNLMERHPHELRRALQQSDEMVNSLEAMAGEDGVNTNGPSTRELRFLIGAKSKGNFDAPLTPLTMLKALIKNFGPIKCEQALSSLRARMMAGF
ncbi:hypothetical protein RB25_07540 [Herbaspirillum rubrisubalbicans]|uniref:Uncharacterized protein n=2 Tax=Herbaspirillum rubrisubalbicans TaxID=80842 RepID=A0ABX9C8G5_9BURK|nr:hypothetical protein RB24_01610 [Herbaspirillum rubrisubalbicans]RAN49111.1 hypothetical protein RB25_07540 [Herbaspirillum rubrisubalbicans]